MRWRAPLLFGTDGAPSICCLPHLFLPAGEKIIACVYDIVEVDGCDDNDSDLYQYELPIACQKKRFLERKHLQ